MSKMTSVQVWVSEHIINIGMFALFFLAGFYSRPNLGSPHLALPFNLSGWAIASCIIGAGIVTFTYKGKFSYPKNSLFFLFFPFITIVSSIIAEITLPIDWLFRQLFILGGLFFLFSLFQFSIKQNKIDEILFILVLVFGLQAIISTCQTLEWHFLSSWLTYNPDSVPRGIFQQVNVLASFLATGLCVSLYLISRPSFIFSSLLRKIVILVSFALSVYVLAAAGSRVGLLSVALGLPLILLARYKQLNKHKVFMLALILLSITGAYVGQSGLERTLSKTVRLADQEYGDARIGIYAISRELVAKKPITGHGIGSFPYAWKMQETDFLTRNPKAALPSEIGHPHNEILLWLIEGGILSLIGILAVVVGIIVGLVRCGFQRGGAYAAMLLPISLHAQVEHPFYSSSLHWFLWLFLIFLILNHQTKTSELSLSKSARTTLQFSSMLLVGVVGLFSFNTLRAESELMTFLLNRAEATQPYLRLALSNIYTSSRAETIAMRMRLYNAIDNNERNLVEDFEVWANDAMHKNPRSDVSRDLIRASIFLRPEGKGCDALEDALGMYSRNESFLESYNNDCK